MPVDSLVTSPRSAIGEIVIDPLPVAAIVVVGNVSFPVAVLAGVVG